MGGGFDTVIAGNRDDDGIGVNVRVESNPLAADGALRLTLGKSVALPTGRDVRST